MLTHERSWQQDVAERYSRHQQKVQGPSVGGGSYIRPQNSPKLPRRRLPGRQRGLAQLTTGPSVAAAVTAVTAVTAVALSPSHEVALAADDPLLVYFTWGIQPSVAGIIAAICDWPTSRGESLQPPVRPPRLTRAISSGTGLCSAFGVPDGSFDLQRDKTMLLGAGFDKLHGVSWTNGCYRLVRGTIAPPGSEHRQTI
jgi:hypothetical protein